MNFDEAVHYETGKEKLEKDLLKAVKKQPRRTFIVIVPASGMALRLHGVLLEVDLGGESAVCPCIVTSDRKGILIDPRALILDNISLKIAWNPRKAMGRTAPMAREWFTANPDCFATEIPANVAPYRPI